MPQSGLPGSLWQGPLRDLALIVYQVRRVRAFGRLTIRNTERLSISHLYFRAGKLVHCIGNRGDIRSTLQELQAWTQGMVRFERGAITRDVTLNETHERLFEETLQRLHRSGVIQMPTVPCVVEGTAVTVSETQALLTPLEWRILIEGTRRVALVIARLVGSQEALAVLRDILDDLSTAFPLFAHLQFSPAGYLQLADQTLLDRYPRNELLEGFSALIETCFYFCAPLVGEREAHTLTMQALHELAPALSGLGVLRIERPLLSQG